MFTPKKKDTKQSQEKLNQEKSNMQKKDTPENGPIILDCGAHIGLASVYFKTKFPSATILAFEPMPENAQLFLQNMKANGIRQVTLTPVALGDSNGTANFYTSGKGQPSWGNSFVRGNVPSNAPLRKKIQVAKLSQFLVQDVDFLKMDIEGAEVAVLRELGSKINRVGEMVIEIHNQAGTTETYDFVTNFLQSHGFTISIRKPIRVFLGETLDKIFGRTTSDIYMLRAWK